MNRILLLALAATLLSSAQVNMTQHTDSFVITNTTTSVTLSAVPIAAMGATFFFDSSRVGGDVNGSIPNVGKTITITPPAYACPCGTLTVEYYSQ